MAKLFFLYVVTPGPVVIELHAQPEVGTGHIAQFQPVRQAAHVEQAAIGNQAAGLAKAVAPSAAREAMPALAVPTSGVPIS